MRRFRYKPVRRGSAYVAVVGLAMLVAAIGVGAIVAVRAQAKASDTLNDAAEARWYATSAVELGRLWIAQDPQWRTTCSNGTWATRPIGRGSFTLIGQNPNGPMDNSDADPLILTGIGICGQARQKVTVTLNPSRVTLTCLGTAATAGGRIDLGASTVQATDLIVASNDAVTANIAKINADIEAVSSTSGTVYNGLRTEGAAARSMPGATAFDYYIANGTPINITSIPLSGSDRQITQIVLSPARNPYGATNPRGIYVIDCQGQSLVISGCRIVGTLVILNPAATSAIQSSVNWAPAVSNYPALLVKGDMSFKITNAALAESWMGNINFNPPGTPYPWQGGAIDTDCADSYPPEIAGLVYVSGNIATSGGNAIDMLMAGGALSVGGNLSLQYNPVYAGNPPPGFYTVQMIPAAGAWRQSVD